MQDEEELRQKLTPEEYRVLRDRGTEAPFSGTYVDSYDSGMYRCKVCDKVLFNSSSKFESGTGWPSFFGPEVVENVGTRPDDTHNTQRTEVYCKHCGSHLGHMFDDGPADKGGRRYCINSVCLEFEKEENNQI